MLSEKLQKELDILAEMAAKQNYRLNSITFYNVYASLPTTDKKDLVLSEMEDYLTQKNVIIVSDGVELEEYDFSSTIDIQPFDPSKIDIMLQSLTIDGLLRHIRNDEIALDTEFQRKAGLWSNQKKSQLIESLMLKIPLPAFYFDAEAEDHWLIIDGLQRITAIKEFIIDETLTLDGLEFFRDCNGLKYSQLPRSFSRRIEETNLVAYFVRRGTPDNVKYNVFKRINTGGLKLTPQEIRHALFQGNATKLLAEMSKYDDFIKTTAGSIRTDRMLDREFVLRFIAVCFYGIDKYAGLPDDYLNETMKWLNQADAPIIQSIREKFCDIMRFSRKLFGMYAFRKMGEDGRRRPINKAVFEIWCKALFDLPIEKRESLLMKDMELQGEFIDLCRKSYFLNLLRSSDKKSYISRFQAIQAIIEEVLTC